MIDRKCETCAFSISQRMTPNEIRTVLICKRLPPTPALVQTAQGAATVSLARIVNPTEYCFEWRARDEAPDMPSLAIGPE